MSNIDTLSNDIPIREKLVALSRVARYRPIFTVGIIVLSVFAALLEGVGLSFIIPIIELVESNGVTPEDANGIAGMFIRLYAFVGLPFTLGSLIGGVIAVMTVRYTSSFLVKWLQATLETDYVRELQAKSFEKALDARISYYDQQGSDDILNAIVTQATYAGRTIMRAINLIQNGLLVAMYVAIALYLSPFLTVITVVLLGGVLYLFRRAIEPGYSVGDRVADANERIQETVQAGTQGIREVKLFGLRDEMFSNFWDAVNRYASAMIRLRRNEALNRQFYELFTAISVFFLIYIGLTFASLSLAALGTFLFAMFQLAPKASVLNKQLYKLEGDLPHLVRTQRFMDELSRQREPADGDESVPVPVSEVAFENVSFSYENSKQILQEVSFEIEQEEFIAFVGPSGAGKSTIVSLLTRMYDPLNGTITANDIAIDRFDIDNWRERLSVVRQNPFLFNKTLRENVLIGNREATQKDVEQACEIAQVTEFLSDLPNGYETVLGDNGVRLSGGQRQRVAIARALLADADLLILDEATSDLDTSLEAKVHAGIEEMERDYAIITIAHRLSTVTNANRIYAMEAGEIVEVGSHEDLINAGGKYAELYAAQT